MTQPEDCSYCARWEMDWRLINEGEFSLSFLSAPRLTRGHTLVIPKRHIEPPEPLNPDEKIAIYTEMERLRFAMLGRMSARGVDIFQKTRPHVPQGHGTKIDHLHFHVLPSNPSEELYEQGLLWTPDRFGELTATEAQELVPQLAIERAVQ